MEKWNELRDYLIQKQIQAVTSGHKEVETIYDNLVKKMDGLDMKYYHTKMRIEYIADTGHFDGLTKGKIYEVVEELDEQYTVNNDWKCISVINKDKFVIH